MNAAPILQKIAAALKKSKLEAVLIGNAAAALNGAPVTTLDFDFFVRDIGKDMLKIKRLAVELEAVLVPPESELSKTYKIENEKEGIFIDIIDSPSGLKKFESVRANSAKITFSDSGDSILVASLEDVIKSKKSLGRAKDKAVLETLELTLNEKRKEKKADPR